MTQKKVKVISDMPTELIKYKSDTLKEDNDIKEITYKGIYPEIPWVIGEKLLPKKLLIRLYDIEKHSLGSIENNQNIKNYAILSYVREGEEIKYRVEKLKKFSWWNEEVLMGKDKKNDLLLSSVKTLHKAIQTCQILDIKYLWMDRLCSIDRNKETSKIGQYYSNASITLIAIQANAGKEALENLQYNFEKEKFANINKIISNSKKILELIVKSKWFSRAWTFQEGILSKRTIFMFDDILVDGRFMAIVWTLCQPQRIIEQIKVEDIFAGSLKIATPLGWVYYKDDYNNEENKLFMNLYDSLDIIKTREKNNALDAIYSVLGLLPYGNKVKINWNLNLQEALLNVAKTAVKNGYLEPLVWHGEGDSWLPKIENNLILTCGGISVECGECRENKNLCGKSGECKNIENVKFDEKNNLIDLVKIKGIKHSIIEIGAEPTRLEDELTNKHHFTRIVKLVDNKAKIRLVGTLETLKKIRAGDILLVPNKKEWKSNKLFAFLVKELEKETYQRIGLVELIEESENNLTNNKNEKEVEEEHLEETGDKLSESFKETQFQAQIQIPPKDKNF